MIAPTFTKVLSVLTCPTKALVTYGFLIKTVNKSWKKQGLQYDFCFKVFLLVL